MCGISGYYSRDGSAVPKEPIEPMLMQLTHRGPDGFGVYYGSRCVLGHARLSIIDLEGGWQPLFNEDGRLAVTYNGEIYNYLELRAELKSMGHRFRTKSDTEVIVHAYEEWGTECPRRFNGQFAFALYDNGKHSLFLCRDRLGVRPLYYTWASGVLFFGSEIKALLASGYLSPEVSPDGLNQIFTYWTNLFPSTPFANVFELPPAHTMLISAEAVSVNRYWQLPVGIETSLTSDEYVEGLIHLLNNSIRLRLRADVPVGAYLSGGLDSSLTTVLVNKWTDAPLKTFSLEFEDPRFDESEYQKEMVRRLGTDHSSIRCGPDDIVDNFERMIWAAERPVLRTAPVPMLLLSELVRSQGYKVVITGEGADEFFLGYDIFKEVKVREFCSRNPASKLRPLLLRRLYPYLFDDRRTVQFQEAFFLKNFRETADPFYGHRLRWSSCARIRDFLNPDVGKLPRKDHDAQLMANLPENFLSYSSGARTQMVEVETLLSGYLLSSQGDRVCMANSVEGRYVFLDHQVIEFAATIPASRKMPGLSEKSILKRIGRPMLPDSIVSRKKFPYRAPDIESFLSGERGRKILLECADRKKLEDSGIFDVEKVVALMTNVLSRSSRKVTTSENMILMAILSGQMFFRKFMREKKDRREFGPTNHVRIVQEGGRR